MTTKQTNLHGAIDRLTAFINQTPKKEYMKDSNACQLYLERTQWFLRLLGNPEKKIPHYVHITGTSGKGSTTALMHNVLHAAGKKVGSTYSPHATSWTERILVNEKLISATEFVHLAARMERALRITQKLSPFGMISFFELMHCMTLDYFAQKKVEWAVIEAGCGGRYDASNTIPTPDITIITNVGMDHMQILGPTKAKIAWEKAGIIKKGTTFITAERAAHVLSLFKKQYKKEKPKLILQTKEPNEVTVTAHGTDFTYKNRPYHLGLAGVHQAINATMVVEAAHQLSLPESAIRQGLAQTQRTLCMEVIQETPLVILDGAHNYDKMRSTRDTLRKILATYSKKERPEVLLIIGISEDKQHDRIMRLIAPLATRIYCSEFPPQERKKSAKASSLARLARTYNPHATISAHKNSTVALTKALRQATDHAIVLSTGSIYLSGQIRAHWINEEQILHNRSSWT